MPPDLISVLDRFGRRWLATLAGVYLFATLAASCTVKNPYYDATKAHHTPTGFRNNYSHEPKQSALKWQWQRLRDGVPQKPEDGYRFEMVATEVAALDDPSITWIGHATLLLRVGGMNILTDPHFSERASPVSFAGPARVVPPAVDLAHLPHIDAVLISHNHYDHLDAATVRALAAQAGGPPTFYVGLGLKSWFAELGITQVLELDWWETRDNRAVSIHFVPVQHWSARTPWDDNRSLWGGFVVEHASLRFFFAGDTGYSQDFRDISARFGPFDLAAIPIGAYEPRWFMKAAHVDPQEAVQIHLDLAARHSIAIHWGTFDDLTDESLYEPPKALGDALAACGLGSDDFWVFGHGETRSLDFLRPSPVVAARAAMQCTQARYAPNAVFRPE